MLDRFPGDVQDRIGELNKASGDGIIPKLTDFTF